MQGPIRDYWGLIVPISQACLNSNPLKGALNSKLRGTLTALSTVDSRRLKHGCRMIDAGDPFFFGLS